MPVNQLPAGSEFAAAISLTYASISLICGFLLIWLTWVHHERYSYLAMLAWIAAVGTLLSMVQQVHEVIFYKDIIREQFERKKKFSALDPEIAISNASFGLDLVLYYLQYWSYTVLGMLVMFWAAELAQSVYQIGAQRRRMRQLLTKLHIAGKFIAILIPTVTMLMLRIPNLRNSTVGFILVADLPLMISLAISCCLMFAVTLRYIRARKKFTQWSPPENSTVPSTSDGGRTTTTQSSSHMQVKAEKKKTRQGLYDRWLMVRFTIAFVILAIFEVTNTLFQVTALSNNVRDAQSPAPDLSPGRAIQIFFLFLPGTTPGIFIFLVFGTTQSCRQKIAQKFVPKIFLRGNGGEGTKSWRFWQRSWRRTPSEVLPTCNGGITVQRSLTVTSASRMRADRIHDAELSNGDISLSDLKKPSETIITTLSQSSPRPLPAAPLPITNYSSNRQFKIRNEATTPQLLGAIEERGDMGHNDGGISFGSALSRTNTDESSNYTGHNPDHSDDSGPMLPIMRHEVRFMTAGDRLSTNFVTDYQPRGSRGRRFRTDENNTPG